MTWKLVKLGDVCNLKNGFAFKSKLFKDKGLPILRISNIQNERIDTRRPVYFNAMDYKIDLKKYEVKTGDLLIAMSGATTGKIGFNESQTTFYLNQRVGKLVPGKDLDKKYLYYLLSTKVEENLKISKGAAQPNLSSEQIKNIEISLPSIPEQQRIVAKLDAAFAEIDKALKATEASAKKAEMLFQNYLVEVFKGGDDWVEKSIDEMTDKTKNVSPNKSPNTQFKYVDVSSVSNKEFIITETQLLLGKDAPSRAKKNIIKNDIILATVRPTLKRIAIVPKELDNQVASTGYVVLRINKSNHFKFLFYFLLSNIFMKAMDDLQRGASYPAVTDMDVKLQRLKVPNYQEQIKIAKKLDALMLSVNSIIKIQNKKIEELGLLKQSILHQALTEKLIKAA